MQLPRDGACDRFGILFQILVSKTNDLLAHRLKLLLPLQIVFHDVVVIAAVKLDDQHCLFEDDGHRVPLALPVPRRQKGWESLAEPVAPKKTPLRNHRARGQEKRPGGKSAKSWESTKASVQ
jgi:hypothetical protein